MLNLVLLCEAAAAAFNVLLEVCKKYCCVGCVTMALSVDPNLASVGVEATLLEGPPAAEDETEAGKRRNKLLLLKLPFVVVEVEDDIMDEGDAAAVVIGAILNLGGEEGGIMDICENFVLVLDILFVSIGDRKMECVLSLLWYISAALAGV